MLKCDAISHEFDIEIQKKKTFKKIFKSCANLTKQSQEYRAYDLEKTGFYTYYNSVEFFLKLIVSSRSRLTVFSVSFKALSVQSKTRV